MPFDLTDKIAIVYGGSYGIGEAVSMVLSDAGAKVAVVARDAVKGESTVNGLKGSIYAVKTCLPFLKKSTGGRVILISSITRPHTGFDGASLYGATKAAQTGFAHSASVELMQHKITINCVLPGNILTPGLKAQGEEYLDEMTKKIPIKRLGKPEEIGHAVLYLASDESAFMTGQDIVVDGGQMRPEN